MVEFSVYNLSMYTAIAEFYVLSEAMNSNPPLQNPRSFSALHNWLMIGALGCVNPLLLLGTD